MFFFKEATYVIVNEFIFEKWFYKIMLICANVMNP